MVRLIHDDMYFFLLQLCLMLVVARIFGELFKRMNQPAVVGEIIGGIFIGPSVFQHFMPDTFSSIFLMHPNSTMAMDGIYNVSLIMMLFISGMEIELPMIWKNGKSAFFISFLGMIIPLSLGCACGWFLFDQFGISNPAFRPAFTLFFGTALSITALPVIAKILLDLKLLNTKIGSLIVTCAMMDDFVGWLLFSVVLSLMPVTNGASSSPAIGFTILKTVLFAVLTLTVFKFLINRLFVFISSKKGGPAIAMTIAMGMCFIGALITESIGIHAVFGAFLMGVAFGESLELTERSKDSIHQFVINVFAPLFFVSIGLKVNFIANFSLTLTLFIQVVSIISKIVGGYIGGRIGGLSNYESLAIGFGINARGAMEIILGLVALQAGLITPQIFVALTTMAILTSLTSGGMIKFFLRKDLFNKSLG